MIDMIILTELDKLLFHSLPSHYMSRYNLSVDVTFINAEHQTHRLQYFSRVIQLYIITYLLATYIVTIYHPLLQKHLFRTLPLGLCSNALQKISMYDARPQ